MRSWRDRGSSFRDGTLAKPGRTRPASTGGASANAAGSEPTALGKERDFRPRRRFALLRDAA